MGDDLDIGLEIGELKGSLKSLIGQVARMDEKLDAHARHEEDQFERGRSKFNQIVERMGNMETAVACVPEMREDIADLKSKIKPRQKVTPWNRKYSKAWAWAIGLVAPFLIAVLTMVGAPPRVIQWVEKLAGGL